MVQVKVGHGRKKERPGAGARQLETLPGNLQAREMN
jgi:hypothetical protein